jgi:glycerol-3-phosphate acyltransferase PlsY
MTSLSTFFAVAAYFLGSVPFGKLIASGVARINITQRGSGNIGATNVARELGVKWGLFTLFLDMLKGFVPVAFFVRYASEMGGNDIGLFAVGLSALLGHQFSIFLKFRGGKGVATAVGVYLVISPPACLVAVLVFVLTVYKWDFISLGSMFSAAAMPGLLALFGQSQVIVFGSAIVAVMICLKHAGNIKRLIQRKERKWRRQQNQASKSSSLSSSSSE